MPKVFALLCLVFFSCTAICQSYNNEWIDYNKTYYKFKVFGFGTDASGAPVTKGIVRIPYATLQTAGLATASPASFQLWRDGKEVPVYVSSSSVFTSTDYIEFLGEINNGKLDSKLYSNVDYQLSDKWSLQTDTAAYFLTVNTAGANKRLVSTPNNVAGSTLSPTEYFMHTIGRYFRAGEIASGFYASLGQNLYSSSYDRGEGWVSRSVKPVACGGATSLPQNFFALQPYLAGPDMTMKINAVGAAQNSRVVKVLLNNDSVTLFQMDYTNYLKVDEQVPVSKISSGDALFTLINQSPFACDEMKVASIELTYPRKFNFGAASMFEFTVPQSGSGRLLAITNFNHSGVQPVLYDVANGKRYVADISNPDTVKIVLGPSSIPYQLVLTTQSGTYYKTITNVQARNFTNFTQAINQGDYLIITNPILYGSGSSDYIQQYKQYRSSPTGGSYHAQIIDINDITDQFAWGVKKHPLAIKNFLRYARNTFSSAPKFAFLIGKGVTYNAYRANESNALSDQLNLVPTWGYPASDNLLASNDFKAVPATPIGRLSVVTPQEVGDYLLKVRQFDSAQASGSQTIEGKSWMKNVLQIAGANDLSIGSQIDGYLASYKNIITDTLFGGNVTSYSKTADPTGYTEALSDFRRRYEDGAALITYFGHSSSSSLDFNLDKPENYDNENRYPVFIANGCSAGNNYEYETNRFITKTTISEKFVLAPGKGAIGYLASTHFGVLNYLNTYSRQFYKSISFSKYNQSVGEIIKEAISRSLDSTGATDFYSRVHAETYAWHGDPAIRFNVTAKPDYVVEEPEISATPSFVSVADSSLFLKVRVYNIGKASDSAVSLKIIRQWPNGHTRQIATRSFSSIKNLDSITIEVPIVGNTDKGVNVFTAVVNFDTTVSEITTSNNAASKSVLISDEEIRPVYPYDYSIINDANAKLVASTVNPLSDSTTYLLQLDTTALFNSAFVINQSKVSSGGVVEFNPGITYQDSVTYYWRVSPAGLTEPHWRQFSFTYRAGSYTGFRQGHLYQNLQAGFVNLQSDSTTGKLSYTKQKHNLFITNAVYPTSGTEELHFSVSVDGSAIIRSACAGSSIIINVFDSLTFHPWKNTTNPFNAAPPCLPGREYNFEYQYRTAASRKNAMDFLDAIPEGSIVSVRLVLDAPYNVFAAQWAADTTLYGSGNSLYHRLKNQGFADIDSFYYPRTWAFIYKKNNPAFAPVSEFSEGLNDKMILSKDATTPHVNGSIMSPVFGPATSWSNVSWEGYSMEALNDSPVVKVIGLKPDNSEVLLYTMSKTEKDLDISSVSAAMYPRLRLEMQNTDTITATPFQLQYWQVYYTPVREGAIAPNLYFNIPDTIGGSGNIADTLHLRVGFKNVSKMPFDSIALKVVLYDSLNTSYVYQVNKLKPLAAGDTLHVDVPVNVHTLSGLYNVYIEVNPDLQQTEQYSFNNFLYKQVLINPGTPLPVSILNFSANLSGADVATHWQVAEETNTDNYVVQHSTDGVSFKQLGTVTAKGNGALVSQYQFVHKNAPAGTNYYRLKIVDKNGQLTYSSIRRVTIGKQVVATIYPNPVTDKLNIAFSELLGKTVELRVTNAHGQQVWRGRINGSTSVDTRRWPAGTYLLILDDGASFTTYKLQKQ
jgi:hypothetical protein